MRDNIIEKLNNNVLQFSKSEQMIIADDPELFALLVSKMTSQEAYNQNAKTFNDIIEEIRNDEVINNLVNYDFVFYYYMNTLIFENNIIGDEDFTYFNDEQQKKYLNTVRQLLINGELQLRENYSIPIYFLKIVLEEKKYEAFNHFNNLPSLDKTLEDEINKYINEANGEIANLFGDYCDINELPYEKYPIQRLYDKYLNTFDKDVAKTIVERISKCQEVKIEDEIAFSLFENAGYDINNPSVRDQIISMLLDKGVISYYTQEMTDEEYTKYRNRIIDVVNSKKGNITFDYYKTHDLITNDEDLLKAFIKTKNAKIVISNTNYYNLINNNFDEIIDDFITLLKPQYLDSFHIGLVLKQLSNMPKFNNYVYNYLLMHNDDNVCFVDEYIQKSGMLERCIYENQIDLFKRIMLHTSFYNNQFNKKISNYLLNILKNDEDFYDKFLNGNNGFIADNTELCEFFMSHDENSARIMIERYSHLAENRVVYTKNMYEYTKGFLCKDYHITNVNHLDYLAEHFGYDIIRYLQNNQIRTLIESDDDSFYKIANLFEGEFTHNEAIVLYDSLIQEKFIQKNPSIINIFADIRHSIEDKHISYELLYKICSCVDDKFYEKNPQIDKSKNPHSYLIELASKIIDGNITEEEENNYYEIIHAFTNYYIAQEREKYRSLSNLERDCFIEQEYDPKDLKDKFIRYKLLYDYHNEIVERLCNQLNVTVTEANDIIMYYSNKITSKSNIDDVNEKMQYERMIKSNIRSLIKIAEAFIEEHNIEINDDFEEAYTVKTNYIYGPKKRVYSILSDLNIEQIKKTLLQSEKESDYKLLLSLMQKYKLHLLPKYFDEILKDVDLTPDITNMAKFINYFYKIIDIERKNAIKNGIDPNKVTLNAMSILKNAEAFSFVSSVYTQVLTTEDCKLIKVNPTPNSATGISSNKRIEAAANQTIKNFQRMVTNIPTFNEVISFKSGDESKKIRVIVGNFTHPANLTHGERTGACMRIGGAGNSLFDFCLNNELGFHIRFEDPETGEYISRVSGFRNGNSVYLNELRCSCNPNLFSDEDVVKACKIASELMISMSKGSNIPIDNVFVHRAYATNNDTTCPVINFSGKNIKQGLPHFYSDISSFGLLMASSSSPCKDLYFTTNLPKYLPAREIPYMGTNKEKISILVNRIDVIKKILNGKDMEQIEPLIDDFNTIKYGIVSQDYYVYIDQNGITHTDVIEIDPRAKEELRNAVLKLKEQIVEIKIPSYIEDTEDQEVNMNR